jgi:hypothetical protein
MEEFVPAYVFNGDLPLKLIDTNHHWYIENSNEIEIRPEDKTWSSNEPRIWKVALHEEGKSVSGTCTKVHTHGITRLIDPHSRVYRHLEAVLRPLEPQINANIITVESTDGVINPTVYLPRHDLTFRLTSPSSLECQSFPGFVVDADYRGIGTLIGLETVISMASYNGGTCQRKILVPKGILSSERGLYGHSSTFIDSKDTRGYFAYEVDELLGRLYGNRSIESDLFISQLHALTSSPLPDDLTRRSGTNEALDRLSTSSCRSAYSLSTEAKSYLRSLASLTPQRAFYPSHLQVMETVKWNSRLPALSQHPYFLPLVEDILNYWRGLEEFHSFGDLLDPIGAPTGMDHLSARADARNWVWHHPIHAPIHLKDLIHQPSDCMGDISSQEREKLAFQVAYLSHPSTASFPLCRTLRTTVTSWNEILESDCWTWRDINQWFPKAKSLGEIWCNLYQQCRVVKWPADFGLIIALGLLGYREVPFNILATLMAVACRPTQTLPECPLYPRLDLTLGDSFDRSRLKQVLADYAVEFDQSEESKQENEYSETPRQTKTRLKGLYDASLTQQINETIEELSTQWPAVPEELIITERRLLKSLSWYTSTIRSILLETAQNREFLQYIDHLCSILSPFYSSQISSKLYIPSFKLSPSLSSPFVLPTLNHLLRSSLPSQVSKFALQCETAPPLLLQRQTTTSLNGLFDDLCRSSKNELENHYLRNLRESIDAFAANKHISNHYTTIPSFEHFYSLQKNTKEECAVEFCRLQSALLHHNYALLEIAGILPAVTPISLLQQLSLINRKDLPENWKGQVVQYGVKLHDAKRAERMMRLFDAKQYSFLRLELQYRRQWDPLEFVDWLLVEIDTNLSIRPSQADMAKEMMCPPETQNLVMQLNMGEGKSSVSQCNGSKIRD